MNISVIRSIPTSNAVSTVSYIHLQSGHLVVTMTVREDTNVDMGPHDTTSVGRKVPEEI